MFCPNCRAEYVPGVTRCADCDIDLVQELPDPEPEDETDFVELVTVGRFSRQAEWVVVKSLLDDAGIRYFARNEGVVSMYGAPVPGPVEVQVHPEDAEQARELIESLRQSEEDSTIFPDNGVN